MRRPSNPHLAYLWATNNDFPLPPPRLRKGAALGFSTSPVVMVPNPALGTLLRSLPEADPRSYTRSIGPSLFDELRRIDTRRRRVASQVDNGASR